VATSAKKSGKNRKYGRQRKSLQGMRYKAENRCAKNKLRKLKKHLKRLDKQGDKINPKIMKVPRGTKRRKDRIANGKTK